MAVVPFADNTGRRSEFIAAKATDSAALALEDSQEYVVAPRSDTQREMEVLGVFLGSSAQSAISEEQMVRLGERLRVEKVAYGSVDRLSIEKRTGRCHCVLTLRLLDVATHEYLDGATADYTTRPTPGWQVGVAEVINEALRSAAEVAVERMQTSRRPRGNVDMIDETGSIIVNIGARDGIEIGMELLVVRGIWNAAQERVVLRRVGVITVGSVEVNMSWCHVASGKMPRTGDKCYVMYRPSQKVAMEARRSRSKRYLRIGAAAALLLGIVATATGPDSHSAPGVSAYLSQASAGQEPRVRVNSVAGNIPGSANTFAWLVFRGEYMGFPAEVNDSNYLIHAQSGSKLRYYEDNPTRTVDIGFQLAFTYQDEEGEQEEGDVDITYNHVELVAGRAYYYKLRRIVDPGRVQLPIASQQVEELADVDFELDPADAISEPSPPAGPVTYFLPSQPEAPSNGNTAVDWRLNHTQFEWVPSQGADLYRVMIYNNPSATGAAVKLSPVLTYLGEGSRMRWTLNTNLAPSTTYYWFIGTRRSGEILPVCQGVTGWVLSEMYSFSTVSGPPPTPTGVAAGSPMTRPSERTGWWRETRVRR